MTKHVSNVYTQAAHLVAKSASGCTVTTVDGVEYLDFTSGIAVTNAGHCHPRIVQAIKDQAEHMLHGQIYLIRTPVLEELASRLNDVTPAGIDTFFFSNSGSEAVEAGVKLARQATARPNVIVFSGSFHGRSAMTMAMTTSKTVYRAGYQPLPSGIFVARFPNTFESGRSEADEVQVCLDDMRRLFLQQTAPSETAAVVIEPVLGEGGYVPAPAAFLEGLRTLCDEHGIMLIFDEVQTGFGRTGRFFALEQTNAIPDILVMAKGMGSGLPIGAIGASEALMDRWPKGSHGGTYCGNPIACASALATINVLEDERLIDNARERGVQLTAALRALQERHSELADVRGPGLMVGCEFVTAEGGHDAARVTDIVTHCRHDGKLLLMPCGPHGCVIRWMPPLMVSAEEIDKGVAAFERALDTHPPSTQGSARA